MSSSKIRGVCSGVTLDESNMMLVFAIASDDGQSVKYACSCSSFAQGVGIKPEEIKVDDWNKFCSSMHGKNLTFIVNDGDS